MKKNAMKNFVFSFLLSLLAVVTVNKIVFRAPENIKTDKKISHIEKKSISLFSKNISVSENIDKPVIFADIEKLTANNEISEKTTVSEKSISKESETIKIVDKDTPKIIYTPEIENSLTENKSSKINYNTDLASATELVLEKETDFVKENSDNNETKVAFADISDTLIDEEKLKDEEIIYKPENDLSQPNNSIQVAQNDIKFSEESEEDIPLMQNDEILHENINILTSAENTQIAMLEPNTLVNSIESFEENEEVSVAEANLKQEEDILATENTSVPEENSSNWVQMSEQPKATNNAEEDSPWVVAKGNRFAKNKIAQFDALEEEKKEAQKENIANEDNSVAINIDESGENTEETITEQTTEENNIIVHQKTSEIEAKENIEFETPDSMETSITLTDTQSNPLVDQNIEQTVNLEVIDEQPAIQSAEPFEEQSLEQISLLEPKPLLIPSSEGTKLARQMMQNLLIPIPEDIMNDADTTPILSSTPNQKDNQKQTKELSEEDKDSGLFKSITSWFSGSKNETENPELKEEDNKNKNKKKAKKKTLGFSLFESDDSSDGKKGKNTKPANAPVQIMPAELKLAFQPNRAEISGHTLKWIHAFADNARDNPEIYIEIRIDGTGSFTLQQKRLNLLSTIFANRGVDFRKVNIVFTSREPNSFIIRNIRFNNSEEIIINQDENNTHYQQW